MVEIYDNLMLFKLDNNTLGIEYASQLVEISSVRLNQDYSHAHAKWRSRFVEDILTKFQEKELTDRDIKFTEKMIANINDVLQRSEGKFRSNVVKSYNFRRVPRMYFQPDEVIEDLVKVLKL